MNQQRPREPQITELLRDWQAGSQEALDRLMPIVYSALRGIASRHLAHERRDGTLATTALVHEAYVRLVDQRQVDWQSRAHFFAIAARMMRRIVIDEARRRRRLKRGGGVAAVQIDSVDTVGDGRGLDIRDVLALDRALSDLEALDPEQGRLVELKFFGGLTADEIAAVMNISPTTVKREWTVAKAWLYRVLHEGMAN